MKLFDFILEGDEATEENAMGAVLGLDWMDINTTEQPKPKYAEYVNSNNGINIYYDYGADYYFFEDIARSTQWKR